MSQNKELPFKKTILYNVYMLRVVIVGYGEMASSLLLGVKEAGHKVVGFYRYESISTNPIIRTFKDMFAPSDFYLLAKNHKIPEISAKSVNTEEFRHAIRHLRADIILVGTWSEKFSRSTILSPKLATINCHPSLLPAYRGPNPYMATICNGEDVTGITFHLMNESLDKGAILLQEEVPILFSDDGYTLKLRCAKAARIALKKLLDGIEHGSISPIEQDESQASYYKRITRNDIYIDFSMNSFEIYNKVRGFAPWAFCYLKVNNEYLKIGHAKVINLNDTEFFVKNKKYRIPDRFINANSGRILCRGKSWLLCSTIDKEHAVLLYDLEIYSKLPLFCKQILTKRFISSLKLLK